MRAVSEFDVEMQTQMNDIRRAINYALLINPWTMWPDPLIHSLRWVKQYPFLARLIAEIWEPDFDPVAKWVKP